MKTNEIKTIIENIMNSGVYKNFPDYHVLSCSKTTDIIFDNCLKYINIKIVEPSNEENFTLFIKNQHIDKIITLQSFSDDKHIMIPIKYINCVLELPTITHSPTFAELFYDHKEDICKKSILNYK